MDLSTLGIIVSLVGIVTPLVIRLLSPQRTERDVGHLRYPIRARLLAAFMAAVPGIGIPLLVTLQKRPMQPDEWAMVAFILVFFALLIGPLVIEFYRVAHTFDEEGWSYRSPWSRHRRLAWADVAQLRWRPTMKWLDFHPEGGGAPFHLSPMIGGLQGLARIALDQIPARALASDTRAVLRLMANGHAATLLASPFPPDTLAAQILRENRTGRSP